ncbi:clustered mitochondria protein [Hordeum vulgare]|nr:clustered mitochondria protein [Hordeum vulgare]
MHATVTGRHRFVPPALGRVRSSAARRLPRDHVPFVKEIAVTDPHDLDVLQARVLHKVVPDQKLKYHRVEKLENYNEISEIADITAGGCSLEMVAATYDERSIRSHLRRIRELLSLSSLHVSLSTSLALQQEPAEAKNSGPDNMEHLKRIAEEMQKQVAAAGAIQPKEENDLEFGCIM